MSKTVIIPDIHNRVYWIEDALSKLEYDKVIFLGDYFDEYYDTALDTETTAEWLKQSVHKSNRIHLFGTHDLWYKFPYNYNLLVSGNSPEKERIINSILDKKDWDMLRLIHYEQEFLFSHAGVHEYLLSEYVNRHNLNVTRKELVEKVIVPAADEAYNYAEDGDAHPWLSAGFCRGGRQIVGGIIWLDWRMEFEPVIDLNQIVGHTIVNNPHEKVIKYSRNYNLDTNSKYIGILENGQLTCKRIKKENKEM